MVLPEFVEPDRPIGRRLHIMHRTGYRYADVVEATFNEVRMTPLTGDGQQLLGHSLEIHPTAPVQSYTDYWGAQVESFDVHVPHRLLEIISVSTVDTRGGPQWGDPSTWEALAAPTLRDATAEFLMPTPYVDLELDDSRRAIADEIQDLATPQEAALAAMARVREHLAYESGVTDVSTTARQAWASGRGVCQDFTHTMLSLLRFVGIPSRYVSGYLHTEEPAVGRTVVGESHAWVEYWDDGWRALDPTNDRTVGFAHVVVARGRDYADVPPLKGIYAGGNSEGLGVTVEITQL